MILGNIVNFFQVLCYGSNAIIWLQKFVARLPAKRAMHLDAISSAHCYANPVRNTFLFYLLLEAKEYLLFAAAAISAQREHLLSEHVEQ